MKRVLRSETKKIKSKEDLNSTLSTSESSSISKKSDNKVIEIRNIGKKQSDIWNINSILSNIFGYFVPKDLIEFSTVCKKWNHVIRPIIHKTIKLERRLGTRRQLNDESLSYDSDAMLTECISHNAKYAHLFNEFIYFNHLQPRSAFKFFQTFKFISSLTIKGCAISQDHFLGMVSPLTKLQELVISGLKIKRIVRKRLYKEVVQLPPTLKKLRVRNVELINNPELFIQTINSHNNLVHFFMESILSPVFLEAFHKYYPSLVNFEFYDQGPQIPQSLFTIFENNTQLISLKLSLECWNSELVSHINNYLTNLEEFNLYNCSSYFHINNDLFAEFSQPTKIKKLCLQWGKLTNCSLNSILLNCPHLEELNLIPYVNYDQPYSRYFLNISNPAKLKKLVISAIVWEIV